MTARRLSLYVHIPFCEAVCAYCAFPVVGGRGRNHAAYLQAVLDETARRWPAGAAVDTLFLGGGTPTELGPDEMSHLLDGLHERTGFRTTAVEASCEANPESADAETLAAASDGGIGRLSIGAQTFDPAGLKVLTRTHGADAPLLAVEAAAAAGLDRISLDLIFAWPGQTQSSWGRDLRTAAGTGVEHISCYALTWEEGTALAVRRGLQGAAQPIDDDAEEALFRMTRPLLADHGLEGYEVSNFARSELGQCRHNRAGWRGADCLGVGLGAASRLGSERRTNTRRLGAYLGAVQAGEDPVDEKETVGPEIAMAERMLVGLRMAEGVDVLEVAQATGADPLADRGEVLDVWEDRGWLAREGTRLRLTDEGLLRADAAAQLFLT